MARVGKLLRRRNSAEQVAGICKKDGTLCISPETIYRFIRWDRRAGGYLRRFTRIMSKFGRKRYRSHDSRGFLPGKRPIGDRPLEVELRKHIGHWEGDTVMGSDLRHCVLILVERKTGYAIIKKRTARKIANVTAAATRAIPSHCSDFKTISFYNGTEFHDYSLREERFPLKVYFVTPYHSWEPGSNENFNGPHRKYLREGICMRQITQARCNQIADDLNNRPRKRYGFDTSAALYYQN